jgi:hypothetical protein
MSFIERTLILSSPGPDTIDVHPGGSDSCAPLLNNPHAFFLTTEAAGFTYQICGRCGTVRISEKHR